MLWYIAFISVLNLGLGYALALYFDAPSLRGPMGEGRTSLWPGLVNAVSTRLRRADAETAAAASVDAIPTVASSEATDVEPASSATSATPAADNVPKGPVAAARPIKPSDLDPVTQLATREYGEERLAELAAGDAVGGWASAALLEVNWTGQVDGDAKERLLRGLANTVRQLMDDGDTAARYGDRQLLLVLPDSDAEQAVLRVEQLRQKVEATSFVADGIQWPTTLTCALADVRCNTAAASLFDLLDEALAEARRYGGNRTFMHDGLSPTPVVPPDLGLVVQQCAV